MISALIVILPLAGAAGLWLLRRQPPRIHWASAVAVAALHVVVILGAAPLLPEDFVLSTWRPERLFNAQIHLRLTAESWAFSLSAAVLLLSIFLAAPTRTQAGNVVTRVVSLAFIGLATAALLAVNVVTVALTWAVADAFSYLALLSEAENLDTVRGLTRRLSVQAASVLVVIAAAIPVPLGVPVQPGQNPLRAALIAAAVLLRVGLFPLHISLPRLPGIRRGMGTLVRLLPPAMGLAVLANELPPSPTPGLRWSLLIFGGISAFLGGWRWLWAQEPVGARPFLVLGFAGLSVMAGSLGGGVGRLLVAGLGVALVLVGGLSSQWVCLESWHRYLVWLAGGLVAALPFVSIEMGLAAAMDGLGWVTIALIGGAMGLLVAGLLRMGKTSPRPWTSGEPLVRTAYAAAMLLPLVAGVPIVLVLGPGTTPTAFAVIVGSYTFGVLGVQVLPRLERQFAHRDGSMAGRRGGARELGNQALHSMLHRAARAMRGLGRIFEGPAAMLWVYVFILLVALLAAPTGG